MKFLILFCLTAQVSFAQSLPGQLNCKTFLAQGYSDTGETILMTRYPAGSVTAYTFQWRNHYGGDIVNEKIAVTVSSDRIKFFAGRFGSDWEFSPVSQKFYLGIQRNKGLVARIAECTSSL